jgi:predicted ATPase
VLPDGDVAVVSPNGHRACACTAPHAGRRIVLTGGPGAGKTAVLELIRRSFCRHVRVLPEAASVLFGGGFPREPSEVSQKAAQRAIFHVQRQLELLVGPEGTPAVTICDRGTLDGLAYWPGPSGQLMEETGTTRERELARYDVVIHLRTPSAALGYNHSNRLRIEEAAAAAAIDLRIEDAWRGHPRRFFVESRPDFLLKAAEAIQRLHEELPACCRAHQVPRTQA